MAQDANTAPNNTVYVSNLNEKITVEDLKKSLFHVFGQFGKIIDINAKKTLKLRGQAFIVFEDIGSATRAVRDMQGFNFYTKPMKVGYCKSKSDVIARLDGSFVPRPKRKLDKKDEPTAKVAKKKPAVSNAPHAAAPAPRRSIIDDELQVPPSESLLLQNLPADSTSNMLQALFGKFDGFNESRLIEGKPGIAFLDFASEFQATRAMESMQAFRVTPQNAIHISYSRK